MLNSWLLKNTILNQGNSVEKFVVYHLYLLSTDSSPQWPSVETCSDWLWPHCKGDGSLLLGFPPLSFVILTHFNYKVQRPDRSEWLHTMKRKQKFSLFTFEVFGGAPHCWLPPPEWVLRGGIRLTPITVGVREVRGFEPLAGLEFGVLEVRGV